MRYLLLSIILLLAPLVSQGEPIVELRMYNEEFAKPGNRKPTVSIDSSGFDLSLWDGEAQIFFGLTNILFPFADTVIVDTVNGFPRVELKSSMFSYRFYAQPNGAFEWEAIIENNMPGNKNSITFPIQSNGLNYFYQDSLTQAQVDSGHGRPDSVVGSYAVYHDGTDMSKGTGKAFHIYRPKAWDALNDTVWVDMLIEGDSTMTLSLESKWLKDATYPVTIDPLFGYDTVGGSWLTFSDYQLQVISARLSPSQSGAIRIDSVLVYARRAITSLLVMGYLKGAVYNYNPDEAVCSLQVVSVDSVEVDNVTPQWWNLSMPSDTLRACCEYMVGFQAKNKSGPSQLRVFYDEGSVGDVWVVADSDFDPPVTLTGVSKSTNYLFSAKAYYTVVSSDTLIVLRSAGDDSTGWEDTYIHEGYKTTNYSTAVESWWGDFWNDDMFVLSRQSALVGVVPNGQHCDSAMYCMVILVQTGTDTVFAEVYRVLQDWIIDQVTWNKYSTGNWGTAGALEDGVDRLATAEQADDIIREPHTEWFSYIDGDSIAATDTVMAQLDPNTIDDISDGTLTNNGWLFQFDISTTVGVAIRAYTRDYDSDAGNKFLRRPFLRIYCSDDEEEPSEGQVIMIMGSS